MNKLLAAATGLAFAFGTTQVQAAPTIEEFMSAENGSGYFNCAYKLKIASKKCLVTTSNINSSKDSRARKVFGVDEYLPLLTIKWPDGDSSRYVDIGGDEVYELINLADRKSYNYKTIKNARHSIDFTKGLVIINDDYKEHIRLW
ncbi:hypothetical protein [Psychrobacter sp. DAB_AL62B]|uniref:hypothetical protein n=1 Tax=Psychrobacter sp. DAB_AL62B TaxID=1028420 RepID=UPI00238165C6|nr:hypothetical protein [Psychrobacter sp. DAB_AL62B]MDE4453879.1 hypothetical protein [Psychrobacter sp. DAB_AL62B]